MIELNIPCIYQDNHMIGYGGNQEWFCDEWAVQAGCASVLASTMYAYYKHMEYIELHEFLKIMDNMFQHMTPGKMGYPYLYKFARVFVEIMKAEGIMLQPVYQKKSKNYEQACHFVVESLKASQVIGMLILHHRAKELQEDNWHWVCLCGFIEKENGYDIIFSDCGKRRVIDARILFDTHHSNVFKMVTMKKVEN